MSRHVRWRRALLIGALGAMLADGPSLPAAAAEKLAVARSSASGFTFDPLNIGIEKGIYARHGLDVQAVVMDGSAKVHQAMLAGALDIGLGAGTDIAFLVKGSPETAVGAIMLGAGIYGLTVGPASPIRSAADLKGKKIGISTIGSLTQWLVLQLVRQQGWKPSDVAMVTVGSDAVAQTAALETHQVDATMGAAALGWQLETEGRGRLLLPASEIVHDFLMNAVFASNALIEQRPDALRAFLAAWYETVAFMRANRAETVTLARAVDGFAQAVEERNYDAVMPFMSSDGKFPAEGLAGVSRSFVDLGILPSEPDIANYVTERFLPGSH